MECKEQVAEIHCHSVIEGEVTFTKRTKALHTCTGTFPKQGIQSIAACSLQCQVVTAMAEMADMPIGSAGLSYA